VIFFNGTGLLSRLICESTTFGAGAVLNARAAREMPSHVTFMRRKGPAADARSETVQTAVSDSSARAIAEFRGIYDAHFAFVWRTLRRFGVPGRDLADAAQEVFVVVHRKLRHAPRERRREDWPACAQGDPMTDPARWSRTPGLPEDLARALDAARAVEPPMGMQQQVFDGVLGAVGAAAIGSASATGAKAATDAGSITAASAAGSATTVTLAAWVLLGAGALGAGIALRPAQRPTRPAAPISAPAAAPAPRSAVVSAQRSAPEQPEPSAVHAPAPTAAEHDFRQPRSTTVRATTSPVSERAPVAESQWVLEARARMRAGELTQALASLEAADRAAAPGVLAQERALLRIRVLHRLGRRFEATQRAGTFLALHPDSPYAAEVRVLAASGANQRE